MTVQLHRYTHEIINTLSVRKLFSAVLAIYSIILPRCFLSALLFFIFAVTFSFRRGGGLPLPLPRLFLLSKALPLCTIPYPALILAHLYTRKLHRDTSLRTNLLTHETADTFSRTCRNCFIKFSLPFISAFFLCSAIRYHHKRRVCDIFSSRTCGCGSRACRSCFVRGQINLIEHSVAEHGISFRIST